MMVELKCGNCDSSFTMDAADEMDSVVIDFANRFAEAHVDCGFIEPTFNAENVRNHRVIQTPKTPDND